jgi:hypothetical protein
LDRILLLVLDNSPLAAWLIVVAPLVWGFITFKVYGWLYELLDHTSGKKAAK